MRHGILCMAMLFLLSVLVSRSIAVDRVPCSTDKCWGTSTSVTQIVLYQVSGGNSKCFVYTGKFCVDNHWTYHGATGLTCVRYAGSMSDEASVWEGNGCQEVCSNAPQGADREASGTKGDYVGPAYGRRCELH